ncbi:MAG: prolipoprotein diacylglyceryl transferase [Nitrospirota bacterium]
MFPVLIKLGPLTLHTYGLLVAVGFLTGLFFAVRQAKRQGISSERILDLGFYILLAAIIGSRLLFVATTPEHYLSHPLEIFKIWEGGLVFYGGLIFAVPVAVWYMNRHGLDKWTMADIFAPSIAIGHAIGRLGCFSAGCCYGAPAEGLPWAVTFLHPETLATRGVPLHPAQIYESLGELANFFLLITLRKHQSFKGQLFWTYILFYSVLRFVVEFFRGDEIRGFIFAGISTSQAISVIMAAVAVVVYVTKLSRKR